MKTNKMYELFYRTGGHSGAYKNWDIAYQAAIDKIRGEITFNVTNWIDIVERKTGNAHRMYLMPWGDTRLDISPRKYRSPSP